MDLTFSLLDGYETVILLDAAARGGAPGTLYLIEPEIGEAGSTEVDGHSMDVMRVLAAAKSMGATWNRLLLVGCEPSPDSVDPAGPGGMGMSAAVSEAVEGAVEMVRRIVCKSALANSANL